MRRIILEGGFPVWVEEMAKVDTPYYDVDEIVAALRACVQHRAGYAFIRVFDHYGHNLGIGEPVPRDMRDAKALIFCPAAGLPDPALMAMYLCAIHVADMGNRFVISFADMPDISSRQTLSEWVEELRTVRQVS